MAAGPDGPEAIILVDGASKGNPGPAGAGVVVLAPGGDVLQEIAVPIPNATNNVAEYVGLLEGLRAARRLGIKRVEIRTDSELLYRQLKGIYRVKKPHLQRLHNEALGLMRGFEVCALTQVPREANSAADRLATAAARQAAKRGSGPPPQGSLGL